MKKTGVSLNIVLKRGNKWSSSTARTLQRAGRNASKNAIETAIAHGVSYSYLENGVVVKSSQDTVISEKLKR